MHGIEVGMWILPRHRCRCDSSALDYGIQCHVNPRDFASSIRRALFGGGDGERDQELEAELLPADAVGRRRGGLPALDGRPRGRRRALGGSACQISPDTSSTRHRRNLNPRLLREGIL